MGSFTYGNYVVNMDDRLLVHLQIVIVNKLRRGDSFLMSWKDAADVGDGRSAVWLHPYMLHFKFDGGRVPTINQEWLAELTASAESSRGLVITAEDGALPEFEGPPHRPRTTTQVTPVDEAPTVSPDVQHGTR